MKKFQNKYRIPSARLQSWDYGSDGYYFITICTAHMEHYFGEIHDGEMIHNELGKIADKYWEEIPVHFPFVELGNYVVMPNHVHGILIIDKPVGNEITVTDAPTVPDAPTLHVETPNLGVSTIASTTIAPTPIATDNLTDARKRTIAASNKWKPETIGVIINQYKRKVSIECHKIHPNFRWQSRFHDHIIRDAQSFENIQHYIETNPQNWGKDKFNNPTV